METLNLRRTNDSEAEYVLYHFEEFYFELLRQKKNVLSKGYVPFSSSTDLVPGDLNSDSAEGSRIILEKLASLLEKQMISVNQQVGDFARQYFKEAVYIMACFADEVFLNIDWQGRKYWEDNLLESRIFGTHDAGDQFFDRLDRFLALRDPGKKDLGQIYLLALGLGFLGKFRGVNDQGQLRQYLRQLYIFVHHRDLKLFDESERLFPESYTHTLDVDDSDKSFHKNPKRHLGLQLSGLLIAFLLISHVAWRVAVGDLADLAAQIRQEALF